MAELNHKYNSIFTYHYKYHVLEMCTFQSTTLRHQDTKFLGGPSKYHRATYFIGLVLINKIYLE